jgi:hypothetical protein
MAPAASFQEGEMKDVATGSRLLAGAERKNKVVHARFSASELTRIERAAERAGLTVSAFMRSLSLEGAGVRPFFTAEDRVLLGALWKDLRAVGVNLDQLARAANRRHSRFDEERAVLDDVQRAMAALVYEIGVFADRGARLRKRRR